jgi:hypothetical protein
MCSMTTTASTTSAAKNPDEEEDAAPRDPDDDHYDSSDDYDLGPTAHPPSPMERFTTVTSACLPPLEALVESLEGDASLEVAAEGLRAEAFVADPLPPVLAAQAQDEQKLGLLPAFQGGQGSFSAFEGGEGGGGSVVSDWLGAAARGETATARSQSEAKWPRKGIATPHPNDVLYGRGGECARLRFFI